MAQDNWRDPELTPEEKVAGLVLKRFGERPPVNVRRIAGEYATIKELAFPVSCDAVTIRKPGEGDRPRMLLNSNSTKLETRKRFTISHEIGHLKIPWHSGSIACHFDEGSVVSDDHYPFEGEAHRFASELLMPSDWVRQVIQEEQLIGKIFKRIEDGAEVGRTAARIKLMKTLPPGFVCVEYNPRSGKIERIEESRNNGSPGLFIDPGDRISYQRLSKAIEFHSVDACQFGIGVNYMQWWRLDCHCEIPVTEETRSSVEILRGITEDLFETRDIQNSVIFDINGFASVAYQKTPCHTENSIFGAFRIRFGKSDLQERRRVRETMRHPDWDEYLIAKARELARGQTSRKRSSRSPSG